MTAMTSGSCPWAGTATLLHVRPPSSLRYSPVWAPSQSARPAALNARAWTCSKGVGVLGSPDTTTAGATLRNANAKTPAALCTVVLLATGRLRSLVLMLRAHHAAHHEVHADGAGEEGE